MSCSPDRLTPRASSNCVAKVADTGSGKKTPPAGTVAFTSSAPGSFDPQSCTLETSAAAAATCTTTYQPSAIGNGTHLVAASYSGSETHNPTVGRNEISVTPANDVRRNATKLGIPPSAIDGTTVGATADYSDLESTCGDVGSTVWYSLGTRASGRVAVRLRARGRLDAVVAVFRRVRSQFKPLGCVPTDEKGVGGVAFQAARRGHYLISVGERERSASSTFRLELFAPPLARAPGAPLVARGVASSVDPTDAARDRVVRRSGGGEDVPDESRGRSQPLSFTHRVRAWNQTSFTGTRAIRGNACGGYLVLTPGPDQGGRYSLLVRAQGDRGETQRYRLQVARAGRDAHTAPGLLIRSGQTRRGALSGRSIDVVDLYRFDVDHRTEVTARLGASRGAEFELVLLSDDGNALRCACTTSRARELRARLDEGQYFVAVRARGQSVGRYRVGLLIREITATTTLIDGVPDATSGARPCGASLGSGPTRRGDRRTRAVPSSIASDPIEGWQFSRVIGAHVWKRRTPQPSGGCRRPSDAGVSGRFSSARRRPARARADTCRFS